MDSLFWPLLRDAGRLLWIENLPWPMPGKGRRDPGVDSTWRLRHVDLDQVPVNAGHAGLRRVRDAWTRLSHASSDGETLAALLMVLCSSSSTGARCALPLPVLRGTDVRPWLSDGSAVAMLLRSLSRFLPQCRRLLVGHRWLPVDELASVPANLEAFDWFVLARCHQRVATAAVESLPRLAREWLALAPPGRRWTDIGCLAKAVGSLELETTHDALALAARVWTLSGSGWLREAAGLDHADRVLALRLLVQTNAGSKTPPTDVRRVFAALRHHGSPERRPRDLRWIIKGIARGASAGYLAGALRVAAKSIEGGDVHELDEAPETKWSMRSHHFLILSKKLSPTWLKRLWRACSRVPGLVDAVVLLRLVRWLPDWETWLLAMTLIRLARGSKDQPSIEAAGIKRLGEVLVATVRLLGRDRAGDWIDALDDLLTVRRPFSERACDQAIALSLRLEAVLQGAASDVACVLAFMIDVKGEGLLGTTPAPSDDWMRRIAECTATWTRRARARDGIECLDSRAFAVLWGACLAHPARWFRLMEEIACVPKARVRAIFESAEKHPLFACPLGADASLRALVLIDSVREDRCKSNPVSTRLREHLAGTRVLPAHLLAHHIGALRQGWLEAQLHLVDELVQAEIWRAFPGLARESGVTGHSVKLALTVDANDRPLRRLIRGCARGEHDWIARHPINQRWRTQLGEPRAARWRDGIAAVRVLPKLGEVMVAPEHDPQEVLRMGTAVRSCLSLGNCNAFAAAANALDANKLVVRATTPAGSMVGRQLLAISEANRLVCFSPYPRRLAPAVLEFFEDYDQVLASYLGIPLHRTGEYTIQSLVAKEWYDDGLWERFERTA